MLESSEAPITHHNPFSCLQSDSVIDSDDLDIDDANQASSSMVAFSAGCLHLRLLTVLSRSLPMDAVASPPLPAPVKDASFATSQPVVPLSTQAASQALSTAPSSYSWAIRLAGDHG